MLRRTVRLRLTLLYGGLFLVSGIVLLAITYTLLDKAGDGVLPFRTPSGVSGAVVRNPDKSAKAASSGSVHVQYDQGASGGPVVAPDGTAMETLARRQHTAEMHQFLTTSGIGLAVMGVVSIGLGWVVAGRVLRPLRTITATARGISATNLHQRLALPGPPDELTELGDTIDELLARLEGAFQAQRRFIANASHELRTPLTRQRTIAQVALADPGATTATLRAAHERVLAAGAEQERLIEALLVLARGQTGIESREPFDLAALTRRVVRGRQTEAVRRDLELRSDLRLAGAMGNAPLAERLVANLLDNALRHNVAGGRVEVTTCQGEGRAVVEVVNTGPEVAEDQIEEIFQPFRRLGAERTGEGLGLGLSIASAIAAAHDAVLTARPRPQGGLTVRVAFPMASPRRTAAAREGGDLSWGDAGLADSGGGRTRSEDHQPGPGALPGGRGRWSHQA